MLRDPGTGRTPPPSGRQNYLLRAVLAVAGAAIVFLGLNVGLGGIRTLGWQGGDITFLAVTNEALFAVRDNHIRFIGGIWLAAGLFMMAGAVALDRLRAVIVALTAMIFVGGLARLSAVDAGLLLGGQIGPSLLLELVVFPLLGFWVARSRA